MAVYLRCRHGSKAATIVWVKSDLGLCRNEECRIITHADILITSITRGLYYKEDSISSITSRKVAINQLTPRNYYPYTPELLPLHPGIITLTPELLPLHPGIITLAPRNYYPCTPECSPDLIHTLVPRIS